MARHRLGGGGLARCGAEPKLNESDLLGPVALLSANTQFWICRGKFLCLAKYVFIAILIKECGFRVIFLTIGRKICF